MLGRPVFLLIIAFWVVMNILLWRVEFGENHHRGNLVSNRVVARKILTSPDESSLEVLLRGEPIGYCQWIAGTAEELILENASPQESTLPEGMIRNSRGYAVRLEGSVHTGPSTIRTRFSLQMLVSTNFAWQEFTFRFGNHPEVVKIQAYATEQTVQVDYGTPEEQPSRLYSFADLRDPQIWIRELGGGWAAPLLPALTSLSPQTNRLPQLVWEARTDRMRIGNSTVQTYRIESRLLERYPITLIVSRVGEILRLDLPGDIRFENEILAVKAKTR